jgi:hypothetical protein
MSLLSTETARQRIVAIDAATYRRHPIHGEERTWTETNCYTDMIVELLHGLGHEPTAMLPYTLAIDFEGDQWTFFKPPASDILDLYGLDIQELAIWRPLVDHVAEQVSNGRPVLAELDSFYLPDTAGTAYQRIHQKTTVAVNEIDLEARRLGYFHNQGYYELEGQDFHEIFQLGGAAHERVLPPYVEFMKPQTGMAALRNGQLVEASLGLLRQHLDRVPRDNPFARFKTRFAGDLDWLMTAEIERFHVYSFATLRQYGACFELSETYLRWLGGQGVGGLETASVAFRQIAQTAKAFQFQLARAMTRRRTLDLAPLDAMGVHWEVAMAQLLPRFT